MSVGNGQDQWTSRILTAAALKQQFEIPDWVIDGIVQRGRLYACTSLTAHGKTAVWLYNGCMVPAARKIAGLETTRGNVLYLAGENPDDLTIRLFGIEKALGLKETELPYVLPVSFPLDDDEMRTLLHEIEAMFAPLALIIIDTAASFSPVTEENENVQAGNYARQLRRLTKVSGNPAVVALCHPVKNAAKDNLLPRGGGAFLNELDGNLTLWADELGEDTTLHWQGKLRGAPFSPLTYRLRSVPTGLVDKRGRPLETVIAEPISDFEAVDHAKQRLSSDTAVLKAFRDNPSWTLADIAQLIGWDEGERYKVSRAARRLEKKKLMEDVQGVWQITDKGQKTLEKLGY